MRRRQRKQQRQADLLTQSESSNSYAPETGPFQLYEYKLDANGPVLAEMPTANQMPAELHDEYLRDRGDSGLVGMERSKVGVGESGKDARWDARFNFTFRFMFEPSDPGSFDS